MPDLSLRIREPASKEAGSILLRGGQTLVKVEQVFQSVRLWDAVGVEQPCPVESVLQPVSKTRPHAPACAEIPRIAHDGHVFREGPIQGLICRTIVDNDNGVRRPGLAPKSLDQLLDHSLVVQRVNVSQNAHGT